MKQLPVLYKRDSQGHVRYWSCRFNNKSVFMEHGRVGSDSPIKETVDYSSPEDVEFWAKSRWKEKRNRQGYDRDPNPVRPDRPMRALKYQEHGHKLPENVYIQPKLDGVRCFTHEGRLWTRLESEVTSVPHITKAISAFPFRLDGELYIHGVPLQQIRSLVNRNTPHPQHTKIQYHVFDIFDETGMPFEERTFLLQEYYGNNFDPLDDPSIILVPSSLVSKSQLKETHRHWTKKGFEGLMVRDPDSPYEPNKRSKYLQKYKDFLDDEFEIVDIIEGKGSYVGQAILVCKLGQNRTFKSAIAMPVYMRRAIFKNKDKYIGGTATVKYSGFTDDGKPFHPHAPMVYKRGDKKL